MQPTEDLIRRNSSAFVQVHDYKGHCFFKTESAEESEAICDLLLKLNEKRKLVNNTRFRRGTHVKVVAIKALDPDESVGVIEAEGELTEPFPEFPTTVLGLKVTKPGRYPPGCLMASNRIGLCSGDKIQIIESGKIVTV